MSWGLLPMNTKIHHSLHKKDLLLKYQQQQQQKRAQQDAALAEARRLALILVEDYGAHKVYLIGPLRYGEFREGMPLELAVDGLSPTTLATALGHLKQESLYPVEIIDIAQADAWTRRGPQSELLTLRGTMKRD
jgi:hypothetical protein